MIRKIKNKVGVFGVLLIVFAVFLLLFSTNPVSAKNEFQEIYGKEGIKIGNAVFKKKNNRIMMQKNGNTIILAEDIVNDALVAESNYSDKEATLDLFPAFTDGKILYYSKANKGNDHTTIYRMDIKKGKTKALVSGKTHTLFDIGKNHIYYGTSTYDDTGAGVYSLYSLDLKTKKKRYMTDYVGWLWFEKNKVITMGAKSEAGNTAVYVFNADGTGKKKITDANILDIKDGKIYYQTYKFVAGNDVSKEIVKYYKCSLNGKNKKRISEKEYRKY